MGVSAPKRRERVCRFVVEGQTIGTSTLFDADPHMGVAMGVFVPGEAYRAKGHAHDCGDGLVDPLPCAEARVESGDDALLLKFHLDDFADVLLDDDARQIHVFFEDWESYEAFFDQRPLG